MTNRHSAETLREYTENIRLLLNQDPKRYSVMVERQILFQLVPRLCGSRLELEKGIWELLILCLEGAAAPSVAYETSSYQRVVQTLKEQGLQLPFPEAAKTLLQILEILREFGVYPKPRSL